MSVQVRKQRGDGDTVISGEGALYFLIMKEIPSDKCLWHHVASLSSKNCNTMSLTQLQSSWDNIGEIYLEIMLFSRLASRLPADSAVLTRVSDSRWRWAFVTFLRNPVLVPLKTGRFPPHIWPKATHGAIEQRVGETKWSKINRTQNSSLTLAVKSQREICKAALRSRVLAEFRPLQPWRGATRTDVTIYLVFYGKQNDISPVEWRILQKPLDSKFVFISFSTVRGQTSWLVPDPSPPSCETVF